MCYILQSENYLKPEIKSTNIKLLSFINPWSLALKKDTAVFFPPKKKNHVFRFNTLIYNRDICVNVMSYIIIKREDTSDCWPTSSCKQLQSLKNPFEVMADAGP